MKVCILWDIPDALRNALLEQAHDFKAAHPGSQFEALVQSSPFVSVAELLAEPALSITQVLERRPLGDGPPAPSESPFERAIAAVLAHPDLPDRAIAKQIGVSHQTVGRARETLKGKPGADRSNARSWTTWTRPVWEAVMTMAALLLPRRARGRPSPNAEAAYREQRQAFFAVGVRGWCYILEGRGHITKGEFDVCENFITDCRKTADLPLDICAEDDSRETIGLQRQPDESDPRDHAQGWIDYLRDNMPDSYTPFDFWDDQKVYVEVAVEKLDLRNLFETVCAEFHVAITNLKGWSDINARAAMMQRFAAHERAGRECVLLMCNDHDPGGLHISDTMAKNLDDLFAAVGWSPDNLVITRFGLNADFIDTNNLTWIDNLETSSGQRLDDPRHPDHTKPYVQNYITEFGVRKCEANALVVVPEIGRQLCRDAILRYVDADAPDHYHERLEEARRELRRILDDMLPGEER